MNSILLAALTGLLVGAGGALLGAIIAFVLKTTGKKLSAALLGLAGGIMIGTFVFDMLPHAIHDTGAGYTVLGIALGAAVMFVVTLLIPHKDATEIDSCDAQRLQGQKCEHETTADNHTHHHHAHAKTNGKLVHTGILLAAGMAIHNLPQGVAIGGTVSAGIGGALALLLLLHNIPEGMAMAVPLKVGGMPYGKIALIALLAALPTVAGALIGAAIAGISETVIGASIAFAGGAMMYLTLRELIPQAFGIYKNWLVAAMIAAGILLGRIVVWLTHAH